LAHWVFVLSVGVDAWPQFGHGLVAATAPDSVVGVTLALRSVQPEAASRSAGTSQRVGAP
jgi:hypothetical protein